VSYLSPRCASIVKTGRKKSMTYLRTGLDRQRLVVTLSLLLGLVGTVQAQHRFNYSIDGSEVTDVRTGLIWRRCSEGQSWSSSTCTGVPSLYTHEAALAHTKIQVGWRLPNVKELSSLVDRSVVNPGIDLLIFPATPAGAYWTASPSGGGALYVDFLYGAVSSNSRVGTFRVRLVR
jgi:hypothetical protein